MYVAKGVSSTDFGTLGATGELAGSRSTPPSLEFLWVAPTLNRPRFAATTSRTITDNVKDSTIEIPNVAITSYDINILKSQNKHVKNVNNKKMHTC